MQKKNRAQRIDQAQITQALENIYIEPLSQCNLSCRLCYTHKSPKSLSPTTILNFIKRYQKYINLKSIIFCGGEVFTYPRFTNLVNTLLKKGIFITIITNGTIDLLNQITDPKNCQLLVSFDGPKKIHDQNRGLGNFDKSKQFVKHALNLGFPVEIMYLTTPESYKYKKSTTCPPTGGSTIYDLKTNFITLKTNSFDPKLKFPALTKQQIIKIKKPFNFGCFQLSLQSNGDITPCCESLTPLANLKNTIPTIISRYKKLLAPCLKCKKCLGCPANNFMCGLIKELEVKSCQNVVQLLS